MMNGGTSKWNCDMCTFSNEHSSKSCAMCHKNRPDSSNIIPSVFKGSKPVKTVIPTNTVDSAVDLTKDNDVVKFDAKKEKVTIPDKEQSRSNDSKSNKTIPMNKKNAAVTNSKRIIKKPSSISTGASSKVDKKDQNKGTDKIQPEKPKADEGNDNADFVWVCSKCSANNESYFENCICCHMKKTDDVVYIMEEASDKNSKTGTEGEKEREKSAAKRRESTEKANQEWSCRRCTLNNSVSVDKCSVCESPRFSNIPSPESIPDKIDYSKFPPSARPPVSPGGSDTKHIQDSNGKSSQKGYPSKVKDIKPSNGKVVVTKPTAIKPPVVKKSQPTPGPSQTNNVKKSSQAQKVPAKIGSIDEKEKEVRDKLFWKCARCTYENANTEKNCQMCQGSKDYKPPAPPPKWVCSKCTYINDPDAQTCDMCRNKRGEVKAPVERMEVDSPLDSSEHQPMEIDPPKSSTNPQPSTSKGKGIVAKKTGKPVTPLKTDMTKDLHCKVCTFLNTSTSGKCKVCQSNLSSIEQDVVVSPGTIRPKHTLKRQQSTLMQELRDEEDSDAQELWQHIVMFCKQNHVPFVDDSFPPSEKSLYRDPSSSLASHVVRWLRCDKIHSHASESRVAWTVARTPMPDDISQGELGNCW